MNRRAFAGAVLVVVLGCGSGSAEPEVPAPGDLPAADAWRAAGEVTDDGEGSGADAEEAQRPEPIKWCEGATEALYDPTGGAELWAFPDDYYSRSDPESPTGLRLRFDEEHAPWVANMADLARPNFASMGILSGFATNGGLFLRFDGPLGAVPSGPEESVQSDALLLLDLGSEPAQRVPYEASSSDEGRSFVMWPLRPMREKTRHALIATRKLTDAKGGCTRPSPATRALITGEASDPRLLPLVPRYAEAIAAAGLDPADVSALTVFTTHGDIEVMAAAAEDVRTRDFAWTSEPSCSVGSGQRFCERDFDTGDYRAPEGHVDSAEPKATWTLTASSWLPAGAGDGPYPTIFVGHGINNSRAMGGAVAKHFVPLGYAVIAADALQHGDHPSVTDDDQGDDSLRFLGMDIANVQIDGLGMLGNFNQTVLDRLQLMEVMRADPDVDGDGTADLDAGRLLYFGVSLGGLMGVPTMALSDDIEAGVITVAGGRLLAFATDNAQFQPFKPFVITLVGSEAEFQRMVAVVQTLVDAADPATWATHVLKDRVFGSSPRDTPPSGAGPVPNLLFNVAVEDATVPPSTGKALARALGIPHVPPVLDEVGLLPVTPEAPVSANLPGGSTAGYFQLDRVTAGGGVVPAAHDNVPFGTEGIAQEKHFFQTWLTGGVAEIVDPYAVLGTPALE